MPTLKSAKKTLRKADQRRLRNKGVMSTMRTAIKHVRQAPDAAAAQDALSKAVTIIDRTVKKGVIHANTAARYKSRLTRHARTLS